MLQQQALSSNDNQHIQHTNLLNSANNPTSQNALHHMATQMNSANALNAHALGLFPQLPNTPQQNALLQPQNPG